MTRTVTHGGISRYDGKIRICTSNHIDYERTLIKRHHVDIDIMELPNPMTRNDMLEYFLTIDFANGNQEIREAIESAARRRGIKVESIADHESAIA
jgi:hypothetical protein